VEKVTDQQMAKYEGLVTKTASMNHRALKIEFDELRQELRISVLKALRSYDSQNSKKLPEKRFVFGCMANYLKDLYKVAGRAKRQGATISFDGWGEGSLTTTSKESWRGQLESEVFQKHDMSPLEGLDLPADLSTEEKVVLVMLVENIPQQEIADRLNIDKEMVLQHKKNLKTKLAYLQNDAKGVVAA
jgi:RNA polymerase sigma factor (sigma-70 family)